LVLRFPNGKTKKKKTNNEKTVLGVTKTGFRTTHIIPKKVGGRDKGHAPEIVVSGMKGGGPEFGEGVSVEVFNSKANLDSKKKKGRYYYNI